MNERKRAKIFASAVLAVALVGLIAAVVRQNIAASRLSHEIAEQRRLRGDLGRELAKAEVWKKDYKDLSARLGGRLPECSWSEQMPFVVGQISGIVGPHGLKIETLQPQPMSAAGRVLRFPMRLGLQADLASLTAVLEDIGKTVPLLQVERLDIRSAQDKGEKLQVDMIVSSFVVLDQRAPLARRRALGNSSGAASKEVKDELD
jgi:Tfp pilus assembly protein PilO